MCDSLCVLAGTSADGRTWFAKNSDRPPTEPQHPEWSPPRRDAGPVRATWIDVDPVPETIGVLGSRPDWQWGYEHGVNEAGVAVGNEAVFTTGRNPAHAPDALTGLDLVRLSLERAATAADAVTVITELVDRYGQGGPCHDGRSQWYWSSFLVADARAAFVVDTEGDEVAIAPVEDSAAISNALSVPGFRDRALDSPVVDALVTPRADASRAMLSRRGRRSADDLRAHLRAHVGGDDGWTVCMHADVSATTASMLASPGAAIVEVLLGAPCRSVYVPIAVGQPLGSVPSWRRFAALSERAPGWDALEVGLRADAEPTAAWNAEAWRRVEDALATVEQRTPRGGGR